MKGRILVTGGMGFIGSNFIRYAMGKYGKQIELINLDLLTYAGNPNNVQDVASASNYRFVHGDIADGALVDRLFYEGIDIVIHMAAESHVDRSIKNPGAFLQTNIIGTYTLLEAARRRGVRRFVHISTDEVYGSLGARGSFSERSAAQPNSPYSASKASSDFLVRAYCHTYGVPAIITRCSNNYGPYQFPEKLVPTAIISALHSEPVPIYGDGSQVRDWLHVEDHCRAIDAVVTFGKPGELYNIGGNNELRNLDLVQLILRELGVSSELVQFVADRPGHDRRYAINARKVRRETGWQPLYNLEDGLRKTVRWYASHRDWWEPLLVGVNR